MVKYCDNMFHALKVTFANEVGQFCYEIGVDSHEVMNIFTADKKLNISDKYLRPGFAFGGSCLPKDLRAFMYIANSNNANLPMLASLLNSNKIQIERAVEFIINLKEFKIGFYGLSFKKGTDDLRESPLVTLIELLIGKGVRVNIFDEYVNVAKLMGGNKSYINERLPHISELLLSEEDSLMKYPVIILGHKPSDEQIEKWTKANIKLVDLNHPGGPYYSKQNA
jgi:GDP-mannose 6-dehydrogenase